MDDRKQGDRFFANEEAPRDRGREEGEGDLKRIKMCYVVVPTPHNEGSHCIVQRDTNKN